MQKHVAIEKLKSHVAALAAEKRAKHRAGAAAADEMDRQWAVTFKKIETEVPATVFAALSDDADINEIRRELVANCR